MPIYEYKCKECGNISEFIVGMGKDAVIKCNECGSFEMEKVMSVASFQGVETARTPGRTCCGREERCESSPCSNGGVCRRDP